MDRKNRIYIVITGIVAITLIWLSQSNNSQGPELESLSGENFINNTVKQSVDTLEGVLWLSDNETKGNLMLVTADTTIYVRTSRDFSGLVGRHVVVSVNGTLENFSLLNIEESITKDGFIKVQ